jgi:hypothetical protein
MKHMQHSDDTYKTYIYTHETYGASALEYVSPARLLTIGPSLSGYSTCIDPHTLHAPHAKRGRTSSHTLPRAACSP